MGGAVVVVVAASVVGTVAWANSDRGRGGCDHTLVAANRGGETHTDIDLYDGDDVRPLTPGWKDDTSSPSFSPAGDQVVFVRAGAGGWESAGPIATELWIAAVNNSAAEPPRRVLHSPAFRLSPAWSPTGDEIAYSERDGADLVLRTVRSDGTGSKVILERTGVDLIAPTWSPDGKKIAYIERQLHLPASTFSYDIGIIDMTTFRSQTVGSYPDASTLSWTPDGTSLLVSTSGVPDGQLELVDIDSGAGVTISRHATKATFADQDTVYYLDQTPVRDWQLAVGHVVDGRLVRDRYIGNDHVFAYPYFGLDAASCSR